jgi:hypothetical protein
MASDVGGPPDRQAKADRRGPAHARPAPGAAFGGGERGGRAYVPPPPELSRHRRGSRWVWLFAALLCAGGAGAIVYTFASHNPAAPGAGRPSDTASLTIGAMDVDPSATTEAIAAIKAGTKDPLVDGLSPPERREVVTGERKFYKVALAPAEPARNDRVATPPGQPNQPPPASASPSPKARPPVRARPDEAQPQPAAAAQQVRAEPATAETAAPSPAPVPSESGDKVQVAFNGQVYGVYTVTNRVLSLDLPLRAGDVISVTCLSLAGGKTSLTIDLGTTVGPGERQVSLGQTVQFTVRPANHDGHNYQWFVDEANQGNPVAEYGLGHLYEFGLGVAQDKSEALRWYQKAADQDYMDAKQRVAALSQ